MQTDQIEENVKKIKANKDSSIEIPEHDKHLIHASIEAPEYDRTTGKKTSVPTVQTFYPAEFAQMEKDNAFSGKTLRIVHLPEGSKSKDITLQEELLGSQKAAGLTGATGDNAGKTETVSEDKVKDKPLKNMNKAELSELYKKLYDEEVSSEMKNAEIVSAIEDKLKDLEALNVDKSDNGTGEGSEQKSDENK